MILLVVISDKIVVHRPKEVLSSEQALGRIADAVRLNLDQLQLNMEQAYRAPTLRSADSATAPVPARRAAPTTAARLTQLVHRGLPRHWTCPDFVER
jgi:hypothetical protein